LREIVRNEKISGNEEKKCFDNAIIFYCIFIAKKDLMNSVDIIWSSLNEKSSDFNTRTGGVVGKKR